jgi:hypothetical protein
MTPGAKRPSLTVSLLMDRPPPLVPGDPVTCDGLRPEGAAGVSGPSRVMDGSVTSDTLAFYILTGVHVA